MTCNRSVTCLGERGHDYDCETVTEAAWLRHRVTKLEKENRQLADGGAAWARNAEAYRVALDEIATGVCETHGYEGCARECQEIARRALAGAMASGSEADNG